MRTPTQEFSLLINSHTSRFQPIFSVRSCLFVILFILSAVICHANDSISPALPDTTLTYKPRIKPKSTKRDLVQIIADYIGSANKPRPAKNLISA